MYGLYTDPPLKAVIETTLGVIRISSKPLNARYRPVKYSAASRYGGQ